MRRMSVSKQMGNGAWNRGERAGSAGCEAAGPGAGPFRARVELLAGRALPAPARVAAPPATNENVRKSMRGNKRADTRPELVVRARLRAAGLRAAGKYAGRHPLFQHSLETVPEIAEKRREVAA